MSDQTDRPKTTPDEADLPENRSVPPVGRELGSGENPEDDRNPANENSLNRAIGERGSLFFFSETGTEGGHWAFQKEGMQGYEGMHLLSDGDRLTVFNEDSSVHWEGVIQLKSYPPFSKSAGNLWIHSDQVGVERQFWAEMFIEELKAELTVSAAGEPEGSMSDGVG
jgi:hypothetical protein